MGPGHTAVNTPSYSDRSRSKTDADRASAKTIGTGVCERPRRGGPRNGLRLDQRWSRPVGGGGDWPTAKTGFADAEPTRSGFPAERRGDQDVVGSHVTTFFSLRLRVAQHVTQQIGSRT